MAVTLLSFSYVVIMGVLPALQSGLPPCSLPPPALPPCSLPPPALPPCPTACLSCCLLARMPIRGISCSRGLSDLPPPLPCPALPCCCPCCAFGCRCDNPHAALHAHRPTRNGAHSDIQADSCDFPPRPPTSGLDRLGMRMCQSDQEDYLHLWR